MKREDQKRIDDILNLWISYTEKEKSIDSIIRSGPTVGCKWLEFKGDFPQLSSFRIDTLSGKVEKMRKFYFTAEEKKAYTLISAYPDKLRTILTKHREKKGKNNPITNAKWTHADIAFCLRMSAERYFIIRNCLCRLLLEVYDKADLEKQARILNTTLLQLNH